MSTKKAKCPKCNSLNIAPLGQNKKAFSGGKMVGGALLLGPVGLAAGFLGKKKGYDFYCSECGHVFTVKKL